MAAQNPDALLRRLAAIRLTELEGDGSTAAMLKLYHQSDDPEVKRLVIDTLGRISEIGPLTNIALSDQSPEYRERALERIKWLKQTSESTDVRTWDLSSLQEQLNQLPPPPTPPPPPSPLEMTVEADKELTPLRWHKTQGNSAFALLREAIYAHMRRDTSVFERILDDDYIGIGPDGEIRNKAEEVAEVKRLDYAIKKFEFDDLRVSGNGHLAFATFLGTVYVQAHGQDSTAQYRYTVNINKQEGRLKIAAIHISRKP
jgi:ketosteroid isomerase-like protein